MRKKRILIVDDDKDILFLIAHSIRRLAPTFEVLTATDGQVALAEASKKPFDLVLTDHMMPEMTGLHLAQTIRQQNPDTKIVLMTAYGSQHLNKSLKEVMVDSYITKPFKIPEILELVSKLLLHTPPTDVVVGKSADLPPRVVEELQTLWNDTKANVVLLLNTDGRPLKAVGDTDSTTMSRLATFVADNFLSVMELATLLGDNASSFKSSYHEGDKYNIYAHSVNGEYFLAVVFSAAYKPGPIWVYTKQAAAKLATLLNNQR